MAKAVGRGGPMRLLGLTLLISLIWLAHDFAYLPRTPLWPVLDRLLFPHFVSTLLALAYIFRGREAGWAGLFVGAVAGLPVSFVYALVLSAVARALSRHTSI